MEMEITFRGDREELEEELGSLMYDVNDVSEGTNYEDLLTEEEQLVLQVVRESPGHALRTVQKKAASLDGSPWEYSGEWDSDRKDVRRILKTLRSRDLVRLDDRSYYPADHDKVSG